MTWIFQLLVFPGLTFFVWIAFAFEWLERKTAAKIQSRVGPLTAGPKGLFQPVADYFKLIFKEEIVPRYSDKFVFLYGPPLYFSVPTIGAAFIPVLGMTGVLSHTYDLLFILFILAFSVLMASILGYAAGGRYATISIGRLVLQYTSYEVPLILSILAPVMLSRSLSLSKIVESQTNLWYVFYAPISFAVFLIVSLAELEKPPFDIPSAKTEIVAGWMTEFSGRALAYIKLTKNLNYVFLSALATTLYLGGPLLPINIQDDFIRSAVNLAGFLLKTFSVGFLIFVIKSALARIKIEQATSLLWTITTPLSFLQLLIIIILR
ncbi:MAG: complex I subunit 1 family protein [Nitrososphaerota archaeon]